MEPTQNNNSKQYRVYIVVVNFLILILTITVGYIYTIFFPSQAQSLGAIGGGALDDFFHLVLIVLILGGIISSFFGVYMSNAYGLNLKKTKRFTVISYYAVLIIFISLLLVGSYLEYNLKYKCFTDNPDYLCQYK